MNAHTLATTLVPLDDPWRRIALNYAPAEARTGLAAIWALDEALGRVVAETTQPLIGQLRLTWWHERLCALDGGERLAAPVLATLATETLPNGVAGAALAGLVEGWEALLEDLPLGEGALSDYADRRGAGLFALSTLLLGGAARMGMGMGEGWGLIDFATRCSNAQTTALALRMAQARLSRPITGPKPLRILANLARARAQVPLERALPRWKMLTAILK
jgi:15-cis-phytoene synthase